MEKTGTSRQEAALIAIDWGTTRFRGYLVGKAGEILDTAESEEGISSAAERRFDQILEARCGEWLQRLPKVPVLMAGMIGSRNGWREVPYVACPASAHQIRAGVQEVSIAANRVAGIVPGLICHDADAADVIRGEETLIIGAGIEGGVAVLPGTHSKWALVANARIVRFQTYMTGEFYGLLRHDSVLRLLAREPEKRDGFARGLAASTRAGGLLHQAFQARTGVLDGTMTGEEVGPFLSGLVIAHEAASALANMSSVKEVTLVAEGELAENYSEALGRESVAARIRGPRDCFAAGMLQLIPDWLR
jgi:2-dehydro-3-deoxygalactonokinase